MGISYGVEGVGGGVLSGCSLSSDGVETGSMDGFPLVCNLKLSTVVK